MSEVCGPGGRAGWTEGSDAPLADVRSDKDHETQLAPTGMKKEPVFRPDAVDAYRSTGHELIPLHAPDDLDAKGRAIGKAPYKGWRTEPHLTVEEARAHMADGKNVGVRLRPQDLVIDVDPRNFVEGDDPLARLAADLSIDFSAYPTVITGSGGRHIYMSKPDHELLRDTLQAYQGIEFKTLGRQVVAAGSCHPDTRRAYTWDDDPLAVPLADVRLAPEALIEVARRSVRNPSVEAGTYTPEQLGEMLEGLDPTQYRDQQKWLELMMACHHATAGQARDEWIEWSTSDPVYSKDAWIIGCRWDSLHADQSGRRITEKTLFKALHEVGQGGLIPRADPTFPADDPEPPPPGTEGLVDEYVWIVTSQTFIRRSDRKEFTGEQFRSFNAHLWEGDLLSAIWKNKIPMRKFETADYVPGAGEVVVGPDGREAYNLWRATGVRPRSGDASVFLEHMAYLFPDETERSFVLDYLALLVQRPGEKIHFALLIRGRQGTGKSWMGELLARMLGEENVSRPSNDVIQEKFGDWQKGAQLAVLEEVMAGKDVINRLKSLITEPHVTIRPFHQRAFKMANRLNLICFTNHEDALPIEEDCRRWLVVFSDAEPQSEPYYDRLWSFLNGGGPAFVADWLSQRKISLNPKGRAPATAGKLQMHRLGLSEVEQYLAELHESGLAPFDAPLLRWEDVAEALPRTLLSERGCRTAITRFLKQIGAVQHARYTKDPGRTRSALWSLTDHEHWERQGPAKRADAYAAQSEKALSES